MTDLSWRIGCIIGIVSVIGGLSGIALWAHRVRMLYREPKLKLNPMLQRNYRVGSTHK
jgi:hypothetical protein